MRLLLQWCTFFGISPRIRLLIFGVLSGLCLWVRLARTPKYHCLTHFVPILVYFMPMITQFLSLSIQILIIHMIDRLSRTSFRSYFPKSGFSNFLNFFAILCRPLSQSSLFLTGRGSATPRRHVTSLRDSWGGMYSLALALRTCASG